MNLLVLDFETYYNDDGYSLKKLSTADYVFDPRFRALGLSFKKPGKPAVYTSHVREALTQFKTEIEASYVIAHHAHFDGLILSHHFGIRPKFWFDTLSMARALGIRDAVGGSLQAISDYFGLGSKTELRPDATDEELRARAVQDAELTYAAFGKMIKGYPQDELQLIDWTVRCFTEPVLHLDVARCEKLIDETIARQSALLEDLGVVKEDLNSNVRFAELLQALGVDPPMKPGKNGPIHAFAKTDRSMQELAECGDPEIEALVGARLDVKSSGDRTRAETLLGYWRAAGKLPAYLNYSAAHTHRWGGGDGSNWQNFSKLRKDARNQIVAGTGEIRGAITAPPGHVLMAPDASQVEARITFWLAQQSDGVEAFRRGDDLYCELASEIFGKPVTKDDKIERFCGKTATLGCGFGMGKVRFKDTVRRLGRIEIELATASKSVYAYRDRFYKVPKLWERAEHLLGNAGAKLGPVVSHGDKIELPNGMFIFYRELHKSEDGTWSAMSRYGRRKVWGGLVTENIVQALARIIIGFQLRILKEKWRVATMTHDELVIVVPEEEKDYAREYAEKTMCYGPTWTLGYEGYDVSIPLASECHYSTNYRDAK